MLKHKVLEKLNLQGLAESLDRQVEESLLNWRSPSQPQDLNLRFWVLALWELVEQPAEVRKKVQAWRDVETSEEFKPFFELFSILPDSLVEQYFGLIRQVAASYHRSEKGEEVFQDLISVGQEALFEAARKYFAP